MEKKPNGVFIFRNDRAEEREARKHSNSKHKSMDLVISKIQTQFEKEMEGKLQKNIFKICYHIFFFFCQINLNYVFSSDNLLF